MPLNKVEQNDRMIATVSLRATVRLLSANLSIAVFWVTLTV